MIVDVHCHLNDKRYQNIEEVIERARDAGVSVIINSGVDHISNSETLALQKRYPLVKASLGIYPLDAVGLGWHDDVQKREGKIDVPKELEFIEQHKDEIIAIGEVGLDASPEGECRLEDQKKVFRKTIELAQKIKKPLIVHTRKAEKDCIDILEEMQAKKVVLHCFTGNLKLVDRAAKLGFYLSIPAIIQRLHHFQEVVKKVPITQLLTETDGPYLSPVKGELSESRDIVGTLQKIAEIKKMSFEETRNNIFANYQKLFLVQH